MSTTNSTVINLKCLLYHAILQLNALCIGVNVNSTLFPIQRVGP